MLILARLVSFKNFNTFQFDFLGVCDIFRSVAMYPGMQIVHFIT